VSFVVEELKAIFDPRGGQWMGGRYVPSLLAAIGEVIERHMIEIGFLGQRLSSAVPAEVAVGSADMPGQSARARFCPRCGDSGFVRLEGCDTCLSCGYSRCG
jgi:ribonucleoside-diphosphate reductase alpha chain